MILGAGGAVLPRRPDVWAVQQHSPTSADFRLSRRDEGATGQRQVAVGKDLCLTGENNAARTGR